MWCSPVGLDLPTADADLVVTHEVAPGVPELDMRFIWSSMSVKTLGSATEQVTWSVVDRRSGGRKDEEKPVAVLDAGSGGEFERRGGVGDGVIVLPEDRVGDALEVPAFLVNGLAVGARNSAEG